MDRASRTQRLAMCGVNPWWLVASWPAEIFGGYGSQKDPQKRKATGQFSYTFGAAKCFVDCFFFFTFRGSGNHCNRCSIHAAGPLHHLPPRGWPVDHGEWYFCCGNLRLWCTPGTGSKPGLWPGVSWWKLNELLISLNLINPFVLFSWSLERPNEVAVLIAWSVNKLLSVSLRRLLFQFGSTLPGYMPKPFRLMCRVVMVVVLVVLTSSNLPRQIEGSWRKTATCLVQSWCRTAGEMKCVSLRANRNRISMYTASWHGFVIVFEWAISWLTGDCQMHTLKFYISIYQHTQPQCTEIKTTI